MKKRRWNHEAPDNECGRNGIKMKMKRKRKWRKHRGETKCDLDGKSCLFVCPGEGEAKEILMRQEKEHQGRPGRRSMREGRAIC